MAYDAMGRYIPDQMGMAGPQGQLTNQGGYFNTQLPQQPTGAMPAGNSSCLWCWTSWFRYGRADGTAGC